ncbi:hypothetical protein YPPY99_3038, partial [Yersinia pestis PY-99]
MRPASVLRPSVSRRNLR